MDDGVSAIVSRRIRETKALGGGLHPLLVIVVRFLLLRVVVDQLLVLRRRVLLLV